MCMLMHVALCCAYWCLSCLCNMIGGGNMYRSVGMCIGLHLLHEVSNLRACFFGVIT